MGFLKKIFGGIPGIGDLIGGAASMGNTALGYKYNKKLMQAQQQYNTSERLATQEYNTGEREAAQAYNTSERLAQNAYAEQMYNTYSSPEALVRQYEEAGLNPRLAIGANSAGSVAASSGHSASVSPQSSGMLGITPPYQDVNSFTAGFVNIANALKALGEAKKSGIDVEFLRQSFLDRLREQKFGADLAEILAGVEKEKFKYLPKELQNKLKLDLQAISKGDLDIKQAEKTLDILVEQHLLTKMQRQTFMQRYRKEMRNLDADSQLKEDQHELLPLTKSDILAGIGLKNASAAQQRASARLSNTLASINDIELRIKNFKGSRTFLNPEWRSLSNYCKQQLETFADNLDILGYQVDIAKNNAKASGFDVTIKKHTAKLTEHNARKAEHEANILGRKDEYLPMSGHLDGLPGQLANYAETLINLYMNTLSGEAWNKRFDSAIDEISSMFE